MLLVTYYTFTTIVTTIEYLTPNSIFLLLHPQGTVKKLIDVIKVRHCRFTGVGGECSGMECLSDSCTPKIQLYRPPPILHTLHLVYFLKDMVAYKLHSYTDPFTLHLMLLKVLFAIEPISTIKIKTATFVGILLKRVHI